MENNNRESILGRIQQSIPLSLKDVSSVSEQERIELEGRRAFFKLRTKWSWCIITWISAFLIFHIVLAIGIGLKWLAFDNMQPFIGGIVLENFLQIIGMGYIIVKFLYPHGKEIKANQ